MSDLYLFAIQKSTHRLHPDPKLRGMFLARDEVKSSACPPGNGHRYGAVLLTPTEGPALKVEVYRYRSLSKVISVMAFL